MCFSTWTEIKCSLFITKCKPPKQRDVQGSLFGVNIPINIPNNCQYPYSFALTDSDSIAMLNYERIHWWLTIVNLRFPSGLLVESPKLQYVSVSVSTVSYPLPFRMDISRCSIIVGGDVFPYFPPSMESSPMNSTIMWLGNSISSSSWLPMIGKIDHQNSLHRSHRSLWDRCIF